MITVYSTPTCAFCHAAKQYFKTLGVEYKDVDVTTEPNGHEKLIEKSGQLGVPVIDFDGTIVIGFDRPQIDMILQEKKLI